ncbi:MAG TPA: sigma-70 family RNA polymerase sigma factor [Oligoflexus sp.]|uniref:RNA polymerase sigma factor n=1 Tax=Oligoflexus sp. TaxID=1971216 RepID=UPI002D495541|nr:sigma-70 family RNA polymerase sigma factor [Oligoflexus sp.]HYX39713.1 sigma-70 family RNA polymerase sigma factor [Oligoflexus sp.]
MNLQINFEDIYYSNIQTVRKIISSYRIYNSTADDVAQQTFLQAFEKLPSLREAKSAKAWIAMIARNNCLNVFRSMEYQKVDPLDDGTVGKTDHYELGLWFDPESGVADLELEQNLALLRRLLDTYKKVPRGVVARLYYIEGKSTKEISDELKIAQNTVLSHLLLFRREMKTALIRMQKQAADPQVKQKLPSGITT